MKRFLRSFVERGGMWVGCQGALMAAVLVCAWRWSGQWESAAAKFAGWLLFCAAALCGVAGTASLGRNLTPFPQPSSDTQLVQDGIYGLVRHPLYAAVFCACLGWGLISASWPAILVSIFLGVFFDAKARVEERALRRKFPGYREYEKRVKRFIPFVYFVPLALVGFMAVSLFAGDAGSTNRSDSKEVVATRSYAPLPAVNFREPAREYVKTNVSGWTFYIEKELAEREPETAQRAVNRLAAKLAVTLDLFPSRARETLRSLSMYVMLGPAASGGGRDNGAEYFRQTDPDFHKQTDPRWRRVIVTYSASNYLWQNEHWSVQMLAHELAHAWQLERWPEKQPEIYSAWENACAKGLYKGVKDVNGTVIESAYALVNQLEYFAELSCAYFWRGEYEPFDREGLRRYDPVGFAMIEKMWGVREPPPPVSPKAGVNE